MFRFRSLILIPPQPLQQAMLARISDGTALALHEPQYNMLSCLQHRYQIRISGGWNCWPQQPIRAYTNAAKPSAG
jgi:hypothetical protein